MLKLVARRLAVLPVILLAVATLTFALVEISPFDPVRAYVGAETNIDPERRAEIEHAYGFDQPVYERFGRWLGQLVQGDLGNSIVAGGQPVADEIASRASASIMLVGGALLIVLVGGLIFGVLAAAFRGTFFDWLVRTLCYFNTAAPSFWIGLLALYVFSIELGWLPAGGTSDPRAVDAGGVDLSHLVLPMIVLALTQYAWFTLFVRNTLLEVLREDAAIGGGAGRLRLARRHYLPHLMPAVGLAFVLTVPHAIFHESAYSFLGLGLEPHRASLGNILSDGQRSLLAGGWWIALFPGLAILIAAMTIGTLAEYWREQLHPRWRSELEL